jgi:predicted dehydrogenase
VVLNYEKAVAILEASWDLPPGMGALELSGRGGNLRIADGKLELRKGREPAKDLAVAPLAAERGDPIAYLLDCLKRGRRLEGLVSLDYTVGVNEIMDAAKISIRTGQAVALPFK